ncbi:MAG: hypothetical protein HQ519_14915 [Planctomycetes bacterium]|nr:hypothetical protein [Planctomycetota bacterium]
MAFIAKRALLRKPDLFRRFLPGPSEVLLSATSLADDVAILIFERGGQRRGLLARQMSYHHVAQGDLAGEPYVVTF